MRTRLTAEGRAQPERGHAPPAAASLVGVAGALMLGIGAANDSGALALTGGIVLAVGLVVGVIVHHVTIEWPLMGRVDRLEK